MFVLSKTHYFFLSAHRFWKRGYRNKALEFVTLRWYFSNLLKGSVVHSGLKALKGRIVQKCFVIGWDVYTRLYNLVWFFIAVFFDFSFSAGPSAVHVTTRSPSFAASCSKTRASMRMMRGFSSLSAERSHLDPVPFAPFWSSHASHCWKKSISTYSYSQDASLCFSSRSIGLCFYLTVNSWHFLQVP